MNIANEWVLSLINFKPKSELLMEDVKEKPTTKSRFVKPAEKEAPTHVEGKAEKPITKKKAEKLMDEWLILKAFKDQESEKIKEASKNMTEIEEKIAKYVENHPEEFDLEKGKTFELGAGFVKFTANTMPEYPEGWGESDTEALHIEYPHLCELKVKVAVLKAEMKRLGVAEFCGITLKTDYTSRISDSK